MTTGANAETLSTGRTDCCCSTLNAVGEVTFNTLSVASSGEISGLACGAGGAAWRTLCAPLDATSLLIGDRNEQGECKN